MGEPANLSEEQTKLIRESSRPFVKTERKKQEDGNICVELPVNENGCGLFRTECRKGGIRIEDMTMIVWSA